MLPPTYIGDTDCVAANSCGRHGLCYYCQQMYETLTSRQVKKWGDLLAVYLVGHKAAMGKRTKDPLGVHLVKLSLKYRKWSDCVLSIPLSALLCHL